MPDSTGFRPTSQRAFAAPMTIGVISDTHIHAKGSRRLPPEILDLFSRFGVGLMLHAGDVNTGAVLAELAAVAPVLAVIGNGDEPELVELLPESIEFAVGRFRFGLIHGHGGSSARSEARRQFAGQVDCAVYGHSHVPLIEVVGETTLFNPGSATERRWSAHFGVGLIHVTEKKIEPELVLYADPRHLRNITP